MTRSKELTPPDPGRPLNTVNFESPSHMGTLLSGLYALRTQGLLLDVTLLAGGDSFKAHRVVLASCSDYFRAMFTDAMKEARQKEIRLNGVSAAGMRLLLDYAYTSRLSLNLANIQDVLSAASHIQVVAVVEACSNYLQSQLDCENCVDIATISETYSLSKLRVRVYRFMSAHLREFSMLPEFLRLSVEQLEHLLSCDFPVDCSESEVLHIVLKWLYTNDDHSSKSEYAQRLISRIHFKEIPWDIDAFSQQPYYGCVIINEALRQRFVMQLPQMNMTSSLVNSRGMELALVKVGGFGIAGVTNEITYYLSSVGKWRHLTTIPHLEQCNFGTCVQNNDLYVVGGCFNQSLQENIHPFGFKYSPRYNKWNTIAPMQRERCRFSLNVVADHLYAIGGASEIDVMDGVDSEVSECEKYDPETDTWESIPAMPGYRTQHAGTTWPSGGDYLFISGGLDGDVVLDSVQRLDTRNSVWESKASLLTPRADHVMLTVNDTLYVCGGWYEDPDNGNRVLADTIDVYDAEADTWRTIARLPTPRYHSGIVTVNNVIYFIGGLLSDAMFDRATAVIECYNIDTGAWTTSEKYPQDLWEHTCITLYIPRCRDDMEVLASNPNC
nr:PREDICTED: kelch-like protein 26 [Bemisia tabaci]